MSEVLVIVPVYNEAASVLRSTLEGLRPLNHDILLVDDGSSDPVPELVSDLATTVVRHTLNLGQGAALQTGMEYARREGYRFAVHFDADGQHPPEAVDALLDEMQRGEADVVFGSRFIRADNRALIPSFRRGILILGKVFNGLSTGVWMTDAHIGLRAMNRRAIQCINLRENRMAYATELLWQLRHHGLSWKEIPVAVVYTAYSRRKGQSSWNALRIATDILLRLIYR